MLSDLNINRASSADAPRLGMSYIAVRERALEMQQGLEMS